MSSFDVRQRYGTVALVSNLVGAQSNVTLVTAPSASDISPTPKIVVDQVFVTFSAATQFKLESNATDLTGYHYFGANAGWNNNDANIRCAVGEALKISTTAGNTALRILYHIE